MNISQSDIWEQGSPVVVYIFYYWVQEKWKLQFWGDTSGIPTNTLWWCMYWPVLIPRLPGLLEVAWKFKFKHHLCILVRRGKKKFRLLGFLLPSSNIYLSLGLDFFLKNPIRIIPTPLKDMEPFMIIWGKHVSDSQIKLESQGFKCENMVPSISLK